MDLNLRQEEIKYIRQICQSSLTKEETTEAIVPDALPDIMRILDTDASVLLRSKEADNGRASVTGTANVSIMYIPDGVSGVRKMEVNIPFSAGAEDKDITQDSRIVAQIKLISADSKAINPRKVMARVNLAVTIACYNTDMLSFSTAVDDEEKYGLEIQKKSFEMRLVSDVTEKTFILSDEYKLPSSKPAISEVLKTAVKLRAEDIKNVGNKIVFKGNADITMDYRAENNELERVEFSTTFSQIIESETDENDTYDINIMLTGVYVNTDVNFADEEKNVLIEFHAVAQCTAYRTQTVEYMYDTYSTQYAIDTEITEKEVLSFCGTENITELIKGSVETPAVVRNIIGADIHTGTVNMESGENETKLSCDVFVSVIFSADDGRILTCSKKLLAETTVPREENGVLYAEASSGSEVYTSLSSEGIDVRLPVIFKVNEYTLQKLPIISLISCDEENPLDLSGKPSVVMKRVESGDTLWKLAKQYHSKPELIREANGIEDDYNLEIGRLLLIPKKR